MKQVDKITIAELKSMAEKMYGNLVKTDVDIAQKVIIVDMEMHADGEAYLLENGSKQTDLWGINLYPEKFGSDEFVEFDSMINLKPRQNNLTRDVSDAAVRAKIIAIIKDVVHE
jgi:hypothetical protein